MVDIKIYTPGWNETTNVRKSLLLKGNKMTGFRINAYNNQIILCSKMVKLNLILNGQ